MLTITIAGGFRAGSITTTTAAGDTQTVTDVHIDREVTVALGDGAPLPAPAPAVQDPLIGLAEPEPEPVAERQPLTGMDRLDAMLQAQPPTRTTLGAPSTPVPVTPDPSDRGTQGHQPTPAGLDDAPAASEPTAALPSLPRRFSDPERQAAHDALASTKADGRSRFQQAMRLARQTPEPEPEPDDATAPAPASSPSYRPDDWALQEPPEDVQDDTVEPWLVIDAGTEDTATPAEPAATPADDGRLPDPASLPVAAEQPCLTGAPDAKSRLTPTGDLEFDAFWAAYPRHAAKKVAHQAYRAARRRASHDQIMAGVTELRAQIADAATPGRFIRHPATWLRADGWADTEQVPPAAPAPTGRAGDIDWDAMLARAAALDAADAAQAASPTSPALAWR